MRRLVLIAALFQIIGFPALSQSRTFEINYPGNGLRTIRQKASLSLYNRKQADTLYLTFNKQGYWTHYSNINFSSKIAVPEAGETSVLITALKIYPNPGRSIVNIQNPNGSNNHKIEIYNIMGNKIYEKEFYDDLQVDISKWNNGYYMVTLDEKMAGKLLVVH